MQFCDFSIVNKLVSNKQERLCKIKTNIKPMFYAYNFISMGDMSTYLYLDELYVAQYIG